jgi:proline iminopeptidase
MRHSLLAGIAVLGLAVPLLAETPASTPAPAAAKEALFPGVAKTLARPDLVLHYKEYGQGEPVLLLAGGPGSPGASIEPLARMVAKRGRALLPDSRGTGQSMPKEDAGITLGATLADFEALRAELGLKSWTVLGFSWGGMLALEYAAKYPGSLKALVLLDSGGTSGASSDRAFVDNLTCRMTTDERAAQRYWSQAEVYKSDPQRAEIELLRCSFPACFYDRTKVLPLLAGLKEGKEHYNTATGRLAEEYEKDVAARIEALRRVDIRALIIHGRQDPMPESVALENQGLLKASRLVWLDQCGHFSWIEQPEAVEKALLEFLAGIK